MNQYQREVVACIFVCFTSVTGSAIVLAVLVIAWPLGRFVQIIMYE